MSAELHLFKFLIGPREKNVPGTKFWFSNCVAVAIAENEKEAREMIIADGSEFGYPTMWLEVAPVIVRELKPGVVAVAI